MAWDLEEMQGKGKAKEKPTTLSHDVREARNASRALDDTSSAANATIAATLGRIESLVTEQMQAADKTHEKIERAVTKAEEAATKINKVSSFLSNDQYAMQDAIQAGTTEAIKEASEEARKEIEHTAEVAKSHIVALEDEARRRSERLQRASTPSKVFNTLKWVLLILLILIAATYLVRMYS